MYERFLVPVDGSSTSYRALKEAIKVAQEPRAQIRLVYVVEELQFWYAEGFFGIDSMQEAIRKEGKDALDKGEALARESGVSVEAALLETKGERIATVIVEDAKRWPADVIVMGTHGRRGFNHLIFGSVAEGVVRTATVPILLIRAE